MRSAPSLKTHAVLQSSRVRQKRWCRCGFLPLLCPRHSGRPIDRLRDRGQTRDGVMRSFTRTNASAKLTNSYDSRPTAFASSTRRTRPARFGFSSLPRGAQRQLWPTCASLLS
eukprot:8588625-Pyramimonas_sp.AAC.1